MTACHKLSPCKNCGKPLDFAAGKEADVKPVSGDISICVYCGHIAAFADDLSLRDLTDAEVIEIAGNREIIAMQRAALMARQK